MSNVTSEIVQFVVDELDWSIEAQALGSGFDRSTLGRWRRSEVTPRSSSFNRYLSWLCTKSIVRQCATSGDWVSPEHFDISPRWRVMLLMGYERWMLLYQLDGRSLLEVQTGDIPRDFSQAEVCEVLSHRSKLHAARLLREGAKPTTALPTSVHEIHLQGASPRA